MVFWIRWTVLSILFVFVTAASLNVADIRAAQLDDLPNDLETIDLKMKHVVPAQDDAYICASYDMPDEEVYIVKYEAIANASTAHHILLFGCSDGPARNIPTWKCPPLCNGREQIMFAWAKNAPPTVLPKDVGFRVGGGSTIKNIVLQIHYAHSSTHPDESGIRIYITRQKQKYVAGIFLMMSYSITIPPNTPVVHSDISCKYKGTTVMHPFAYRTHAHDLGTVISGYLYNNTYNMIGKGNPQWPQAFYPVKGLFSVKPGDIMLARCTFNSTGRNRYTYIGPTGKDEMCNFYTMFYTDSSVQTTFSQCGDTDYPNLIDGLPADSDTPLPPNKLLDEKAGHHHIHHPPVHTNQPMIQPNTGNSNSLPHSQPDGHRDYSDYQSHYYPQQNFNNNPRYRKRYGQDYYDYDNGDHAQWNNYDTDSSKHDLDVENGRSRNRNKQFMAMNDQIKEFSHLKPQKSKSSSVPGTTIGLTMKTTTVEPGMAIKGDNIKILPTTSATREKENTDLIFDSKWPSPEFKLGQVTGIATDVDGNVYIFHRGSTTWDMNSFDIYNKFRQTDQVIKENTILVFNKEGKLNRSFGANKFFMPHGLAVDNQKNVWVTDVGLHQVLRFPVGEDEPNLVLGERFIPESDDNHFCKPTDVAVLSNGDFFIADGYCNGRIMKFSSTGTLLKQFGKQDLFATENGAPPTGMFDVPHSITVAEDKGLVCVADRENGRIQCFDLEGHFSHQMNHTEFGPRLFAVEYSPIHAGVLFAVNGAAIGKLQVPVQGFTMEITTGKLLQTWNIPQGLDSPHDVAVNPVDHAVYVGELDQTIWKFNMAHTAIIPNLDKKNNVPISSGIEEDNDEVNDEVKKPDVTPSIVIGVLLVVPVVLVIVITVIVRMYHTGKCGKKSKGNKVFNIQNFFTSHKGFDRLSTEESDHEFDQFDGSDQEEYTAPVKQIT